MGDLEVQKHSVHTLVFRSLKRTHDTFLSEQGTMPAEDEKAKAMKIACKIRDEYGMVQNLVSQEQKTALVPANNRYPDHIDHGHSGSSSGTIVTGTYPYPAGPGVPLDAESTQRVTREPAWIPDRDTAPTAASVTEIQQHAGHPDRYAPPASNRALVPGGDQKMLIPRKAPMAPKPMWHPPWKLARVISGHHGWVRCVDVEPGNEYFVTGAADRVIKVIRHYHGHLSAVYSIDIHPTIDVIITCGRDATARVWDMRTMAQIHCLAGHTNTVAQVKCQAAEPQIVTASHDCTIRLWDLAAGRSKVTLTNHKKSVRSVTLHPTQYTMASASPDNIKQWKFPDGEFIQNLSGHSSIINTLSVNADGVLVSGGDNGLMYFWDWKSGHSFQKFQAAVQPGSIDSEAGIFASTFDKSGSRLITCEADKTIKIYKEDETATEETHPLNWKPEILRKKHY